MSIVQDNPAPAADEKAISELQPVVDKLTPAGKRKLLARIARTFLTDDVYDVPLADEEGDVFAYLYSTKKPVLDFTETLTKEELANFEKNLLDPKNHMTVEEVLDLLDEADARRNPQQ